MKQINSTLYGKAKDGSVQEWKVFVDGNKVIVEYGKIDGKKQIKETICDSKNRGRSNETTPEGQAVLEADSKWNAKYDRNLYRETIEELEEGLTKFPMLAHDATKHPKKIQFPCMVSRKLDGVRAFVFLEDGEIKAFSRKGVQFDLPQTLEADLKSLMETYEIDIMDGEFYYHGLSLQAIVSATKNSENLNREMIEFWCFDLPSDEPWEDRWTNLASLNLSGTSKVKRVEHEMIDRKEQLPEMLEEFMDEGYEGVMIRNLDGNYLYGKRSHDLLKLKKFKDSEAKIESVVEDKNGEGVLECLWKNESGNMVRFECKMRGDHHYRSFENMQTKVGSWINFKYQQETNDGIPQFPVGMSERPCDDDGNPLF